MQNKLDVSQITNIPEDENSQKPTYQELLEKLQNNKNQAKKDRDVINKSDQTVKNLKVKLAQALKEIASKTAKSTQEMEQLVNNAKIPLQNQIKKLKSQNTSLKDKLAFQSEELKQKLKQEQDKYTNVTFELQALRNKLAQQIKASQDLANQKDLLELTLQENSIRPIIKQKVIVKASQADLYNENKRLAFDVETLKKQLKIQEQLSAKKENGLKKAIQNYETFQINRSTIINPVKPSMLWGKGSKSFIDPKVLNAYNFDFDEESESENISSFKRGHRTIFSQIDKYYQTLQPKETTFFLNALGVYSEQRLQNKGEVSSFLEL